MAHSYTPGLKVLKKLSLPVIIRPSFTLGGTGGGIAYMQACFDRLSKKYKVSKLGLEEGLAKFKEKKPAQYDLRSQYNDEILKNLKVPLLAFTHPKDPFEGLTSDWLDQIDGMKRVVISKDYTIDGKKCFKLGKNKNNRVGVLIKSGKTRKQVKNETSILKERCLSDIKEYLRKHNLIKVGTPEPTAA